jgi:predicted RNA-binding Zn ribbon-like protein
MSSSLHSRAFELVGAHPALDLVNTLDWRFRTSGSEELLGNYDDLLRFVVQSDLLQPSQVAEILRSAPIDETDQALIRCRSLREAAAEVFYAAVEGREPAAEPVRLLDTMFKEARRRQDLFWDQFRLRWQLQSGVPGAEFLVWVLSISVARLLLSDDMRRLRACENPDCRWLFLDTSKNHTRRWCDMKVCGNRMKARRFKAQHKS